MTFDQVKTLYATTTNKDENIAAKQLRARLRGNFETLVEMAPDSYGPEGKVKEVANDKRPWGDIPATFVREVLKIETKAKA